MRRPMRDSPRRSNSYRRSPAATDDLASARELLEASLSRLAEADVEAETGITLLHLGSLLADEGDVAAALPALRRALRIAASGGNPLARGQALAALLLAEWKGGELDAAGIHLEAALAVIDPEADRWVLVEAVKVVARSLALTGRSGAAELLGAAAAIRADIRQPVTPTDVADIEATRARLGIPEPTLGFSSHSATDVHRDARTALLEVSRRMAS
jgi:tetratricopeptide (TPR) repeat protein